MNCNDPNLERIKHESIRDILQCTYEFGYIEVSGDLLRLCGITDPKQFAKANFIDVYVLKFGRGACFYQSANPRILGLVVDGVKKWWRRTGEHACLNDPVKRTEETCLAPFFLHDNELRRYLMVEDKAWGWWILYGQGHIDERGL